MEPSGKLQRIAVVGTCGSGKSTLAVHLADLLGGVAVDLDELHWEPNWTGVPDEVFFERLEKALQVPCWVTAGNYSRTQNLYLSQAQAVVWLDYSLPVVLWRLVRRTWRRNVFREPCCNGNYESVRRTFSRDSIFLWAIRTHGRRQEQYNEFFGDSQYPHLRRIRHRSPRETRRWLRQLEREMSSETRGG